MRQQILLVLLFLGSLAHAEGPDAALILPYGIDSVETNLNLKKGKSRIVVFVANRNIVAGDKILYGSDGSSSRTSLSEQKSFEFEVNAGEHIFQFYPKKKADFVEITTSSIQVESKTTTYMTINFRVQRSIDRDWELNVRKPVIYIYPTNKTDVTVSVQPKGELNFTYPKYDDKWECTAFPSGEILIDDNSYNYLFWEAEQTVEIKELNRTEGMVVAKDHLMLFLESTLDEFGFASKEKMDFITYWAPLMLKYEATEIRFMFNEECAFFADLEIEPKPDNLLRFYMVWNPTDAFYIDPDMMFEVPQQIRTGFTVLEWGGMEIPRGDRQERVK